MTVRPYLLLALLLALLLPIAAHAAGKPAPTLSLGTDYVEIASGQPYAPVAGKIEVAEVFGYTCPHCAHFEPLLAKWKAKQATDVKLTPIAAPFGSFWTPYAKAFYTAQALGVQERSHVAMFRALHEEGSLPRNVTATELAEFYSKHGADPKRFTSTFDSPAIQVQLDRADAFIQRSGVEVTPTLVINGKYRVLGSSFEDMLRIADALIARERAARKR